MSAPLELYRLQLPVSGKLKFRAMALMAEGGEEGRIEAAAMLREAARIERRCVELLPHAPPETRLAAVIEECGCLLAAGDPPGAAEAWRRVQRERELVTTEVASSMLSRLEPRFREEMARFQLALRAAPVFRGCSQGAQLPLYRTRERRRLEAELARLTVQFPGFPVLWWTYFLLAFAAESLDRAGAALDVFGRLEPGDPGYEAEHLALDLLRFPDRQLELLDASYRRIDHAPWQLCYVHAMAEIRLARATGEKDRLTRAQAAAGEGLRRDPPDSFRRWLRAIQLLADDGLRGREPTMDILYAVGLRQDAAYAEASGSTDVLDVIRAHAPSANLSAQLRAA